jgi:hypothetical protein
LRKFSNLEEANEAYKKNTTAVIDDVITSFKNQYHDYVLDKASRYCIKEGFSICVNFPLWRRICKMNKSARIECLQKLGYCIQADLPFQILIWSS